MSLDLPVVDVAVLRGEPDGAAARATVEALDEACCDTGFFAAAGHGLDGPMAAVFEAARAFFALPQDDKERVPRINRYGFVPLAGQARDPERPANSFEHLDLGLADEVPWPELAGFAEAVRAYQRAALETAAAVLRALAVALGAEAGFFAARMTRPQCRLRLMHYPAGPPDGEGPRPVLSEPHTDYGAITLLATDGVPGLEVRPRGGDWAPVAARADHLVVNLGDMLARWTNDRYRSTLHRVTAPAGPGPVLGPVLRQPRPGHRRRARRGLRHRGAAQPLRAGHRRGVPGRPHRRGRPLRAVRGLSGRGPGPNWLSERRTGQCLTAGDRLGGR